jgi:hypothetical protein
MHIQHIMNIQGKTNYLAEVLLYFRHRLPRIEYMMMADDGLAKCNMQRRRLQRGEAGTSAATAGAATLDLGGGVAPAQAPPLFASAGCTAGRRRGRRNGQRR